MQNDDKKANNALAVVKMELLPFWNRLTKAKQELLRDEFNQLAAAQMRHKTSGLEMGEHILAIYKTCEPYSGAFAKFVSTLGFTDKTARRYMDTYTNVHNKFPENVIKAFAARGMNFLSYDKEMPFGKYTEVIKKLPPPRGNPTIIESNRYAEQVEQTRKERNKALADRGETETTPASKEDRKKFLIRSYRDIRNALQLLRPNQRRPFLDDLFGMALTEAGIASKTWFEPAAIPEEFSRQAGYPKGRPRNQPLDEATA